MENKDITRLLLGLCQIMKQQVETVRDLQVQAAGVSGTMTGYNRDQFEAAAKRSSPEILDSISPSLDWLEKALLRLGEEESS
jgi:hypothetical protein